MIGLPDRAMVGLVSGAAQSLTLIVATLARQKS